MFLKRFFDTDHFKILYWICYYIASILSLFFGHKVRGILTPQPEIKLALKGEVLVTGLPGKSQDVCFIYSLYLAHFHSMRELQQLDKYMLPWWRTYFDSWGHLN